MDVKERLLKRIDLVSPEIIEISNLIHKKPESGYNEFESVKLLTSRLADHGFRIEYPVKAMPTAFKASYIQREIKDRQLGLLQNMMHCRK